MHCRASKVRRPRVWRVLPLIKPLLTVSLVVSLIWNVIFVEAKFKKRVSFWNILANYLDIVIGSLFLHSLRIDGYGLSSCLLGYFLGLDRSRKEPLVSGCEERLLVEGMGSHAGADSIPEK